MDSNSGEPSVSLSLGGEFLLIVEADSPEMESGLGVRIDNWRNADKEGEGAI